MSFRTLTLLALVVTSVAAADSPACGWNSPGATFDLTALQHDWTAIGGDIPCTTETETNYTYSFNICQAQTKTLPSFCSGCAMCDKAAVVQHSVESVPANERQCKNAGTATSMTWALIDGADPSKGVKLTYGGGDRCHTNNVDRQTTLLFKCEDRAIPIVSRAEEPEGEKSCKYEIDLPSYYGCPKECPIGGDDRKLCGGHGLCNYDSDKKAARCFCNEGYEGADCTTVSSTSGVNGTIVGLLVTIFLVSVVLVGALALLYRQVKAYRSDAANYMALRGQEMTENNI